MLPFSARRRRRSLVFEEGRMGGCRSCSSWKGFVPVFTVSLFNSLSATLINPPPISLLISPPHSHHHRSYYFVLRFLCHLNLHSIPPRLQECTTFFLLALAIAVFSCVSNNYIAVSNLRIRLLVYWLTLADTLSSFDKYWTCNCQVANEQLILNIHMLDIQIKKQEAGSVMCSRFECSESDLAED